MDNVWEYGRNIPCDLLKCNGCDKPDLRLLYKSICLFANNYRLDPNSVFRIMVGSMINFYEGNRREIPTE